MNLTQLEAMALTYVIEAAVAAALARTLQLSPLNCAGAAIAGTTLTHPVLWAVFASAQNVTGALTTPILEAVVILAEAPAYRLIATPRWDDALLLSLLVNAASWGAGELIYALT
ncbi:MAG: hypothetical protein SGJ03_11130 [Alphaproteobacteria bacterium]|nr:hypothetical protein [Alphaproteobacteria bacterium]